MDCGMRVICDGSLGKVFIDPDKKTTQYYARKIKNIEEKKKVCAIKKDLSFFTKTGLRINLKVNVSTPAELNIIEGMPYDGIGLLRTEFLFMQRSEPPSAAQAVPLAG